MFSLRSFELEAWLSNLSLETCLDFDLNFHLVFVSVPSALDYSGPEVSASAPDSFLICSQQVSSFTSKEFEFDSLGVNFTIVRSLTRNRDADDRLQCGHSSATSLNVGSETFLLEDIFVPLLFRSGFSGRDFNTPLFALQINFCERWEWYRLSWIQWIVLCLQKKCLTISLGAFYLFTSQNLS